MVKHWSRLPRGVADALFLEAFKVWFDRTLSNLMWFKRSLPIARGLD